MPSGQGEMGVRGAVNFKKVREGQIGEMNNFCMSVFSFVEHMFELKACTVPINS